MNFRVQLVFLNEVSRRIASGQHVFSLIEQILKTSDVQTEVGL